MITEQRPTGRAHTSTGAPIPIPDKTCRRCSEPVPQYRSVFCSQACQDAWNRQAAPGRYIPGKSCHECGGPIPWRPGTRNRETAKFCGNPCKFAYQARNPARRRIARITVPCATCGKPVSFLPSQRGSYREGRSDNIYCSKECKGIGHSKLMTGRRPSNGIYTSPSTFRATIRREFHDRCALCSWAEAPCDVAHIIDRQDGGEDTLENVVMLCPNHHRLFGLGKIPVELIRQARETILKHQPPPP